MAIKIDKTALAQKINALEGLDAESKSQLLELLHERKRYGLIWEEKEEDVEERLRNELPVLQEVKERAILADDPEAPNHILIEGDNLEALTTLSYTHDIIGKMKGALLQNERCTKNRGKRINRTRKKGSFEEPFFIIYQCRLIYKNTIEWYFHISTSYMPRLFLLPRCLRHLERT